VYHTGSSAATKPESDSTPPRTSGGIAFQCNGLPQPLPRLNRVEFENWDSFNSKKARQIAGPFCFRTFKCCLKLFVELADGARDINSARDTAFAVLDALDDARCFATFRTVG